MKFHQLFKFFGYVICPFLGIMSTYVIGRYYIYMQFRNKSKETIFEVARTPLSTNMLVCCFFFQPIKHWDTRLLLQLPSDPDPASRCPVLIKHSWRWTRLGLEKRPGHSKATRSRYLYSYLLFTSKFICIYDVRHQPQDEAWCIYIYIYFFFWHILSAFRFGQTAPEIWFWHRRWGWGEATAQVWHVLAKKCKHKVRTTHDARRIVLQSQHAWENMRRAFGHEVGSPAAVDSPTCLPLFAL